MYSIKQRFNHIKHSTAVLAGMLTRDSVYSGPMLVQIGITNRCNFRCVFCWFQPTQVSAEFLNKGVINTQNYMENPHVIKNQAVMPYELFTSIIDDIYALGTRRVELVGAGEPFSHKQILEMISYVKKLGMYCAAVTNGSLLTQKKVEFLVDNQVDHVTISLDAASAETHEKIHLIQGGKKFRDILAMIGYLIEYRDSKGSIYPRVAVSFVSTSLNYFEAEQVLDICAKIGVDEVLYRYALIHKGIEYLDLGVNQKREFGKLMRQIELKANQLGIVPRIELPTDEDTPALVKNESPPLYLKIPCYVGWYLTLITAEGTVYPCCQCVQNMGQVGKQSFRDIWFSDKYRQFRNLTKGFPINKGGGLDGCRCDMCGLDRFNLSLYNKIHFYKKVKVSPSQQEVSLGRMISRFLGWEGK